MPPLSPADFVRGSLHTPVVIVHYGDFECPYSGALVSVLRDLQSQFGDRIAVVFRQFPLADVHPRALPSALVAQATGDEFWAMHDLLFQNQGSLQDDDLVDYWAEIGRDPRGIWLDSHAPEIRQAVETSVQNAKEIGLHGTPSVFINGQFHDNREGLWEIERLLPLVENAIKNASSL